MGVIKRLNESLSNKIAAGEVVERPASVVKELVENAIDAGATAIDVDIEEGGLNKIKVVDNGCGFAPEDCELAFERHATSKIQEDADLFHIRTLGFRGEALPSIAAVAYVELKTSNGEGPGTHLVLQGGHLIQSGHCESRKGTEITVRSLFYNTPARLKYLKTIHTELGKVTDVINRMALSYPHIAFKLDHNGKTMFQTNGRGELRQVLAAIYGLQTAKAAFPFAGDSLDFHIEGLAVHPQLTRAGRQYVYIFINGRFIKNYPIFNSILAGYHTLLPIGRYPICVIHVRMDPTLVDVNVHPAKLEARISKEKDLCGLIEETIRAAFHRERLIPAVEQKALRPEKKSEQQRLDFSPAVETAPDMGAVDEREVSDPAPPELSHAGEIHEAPEQAFFGREMAVSSEPDVQFNDESAPVSEPDDGISDDSPDKADNENETAPRRMPKLYPIGQMHGTYIFAESEEGLYIIDQHAAQERIKYEFYREKVGETAREVQELLVPITLEFTAADYVTIMEYHDYLKQIGLDFEPFGGRSMIVRSHPQWMPKGREKETIEDIVGQLVENRHVSIKKLREKLAIMMSCKRSIKANHHLRDDEIEALLDQLSRAQDPFTCPHGRPVIIHFSTYEMEKMFKRVM